MKVLMLVPNLQVANGVASFVMNYLRQLDRNAVQVDIATYQKGDSIYYKEVENFGVKMYFLPCIKNIPIHIKACNEILSEGHYDIVHNNTLHISIPMMWCAKRAGIPIRILHSHNSKMGETSIKELRNKMFLPILRSLATNYVACSQLAGQVMFGKLGFTVIPNVIQTEKCCFNPTVRERVRKGMNVQNKYIIGTVGRLAYQKNPFFAVDVFESLLKKVPNVEYWWVGNGPLYEQVSVYAKEKGLAKYINFLGNRNDVLDLYQAMDCFFLPSLFEGLPVTGIEAQAMGLPMVVSDTVTDEMIYTDLIDYVSLNEKKEIWAEHLKMVLRKKTDREQYVECLKRSSFSDDRCGKQLERVYRQFIDVL